MYVCVLVCVCVLTVCTDGVYINCRNYKTVSVFFLNKENGVPRRTHIPVHAGDDEHPLSGGEGWFQHPTTLPGNQQVRQTAVITSSPFIVTVIIICLTYMIKCFCEIFKTIALI